MSYSDITSQVKSSVPAVPQIYAYTTPEIRRHDGWTKIGYTEQETRKRIGQQTHTADVEWKLEWRGNATYEDDGKVFKDHAFHVYLRRLGVAEKPGTEWFEIEPGPAHVRFYEFRENHGILNSSDAPEPVDYVLRNEQEEAVKAAYDYSQLHEGGEFLWNAKPRFGKTLASYDLAKRLGASKVLVVTNRPAIANSWYDDYIQFLGPQSGYRFVSSVDGIAGRPLCLSAEEFRRLSRTEVGVKRIEFVSLQDLKGSVRFGGPYDKLNEVADLEWDLLIVDEAHEGVDTYKTDVAFDHINRRFTLHLSGTPFKAIANEKFPETAIYNWTYADEQQAKADWDDPEVSNPYSVLPKLNMFTYQMSDIIRDEVSRGADLNNDGTMSDYAFDLNEFFAAKPAGASGTPVFVHNDDVDRFLDSLATQTKYPFSTPELRDELKHTLWMLDRVDSAKAMARKLKNHPVFKDYEIVLAAGNGKLDDADENKKAFDRVVEAIETHDRTITLSVGQLTTGVTIPEWTAVLMLSNMRSPALYMQAAFRAQNPCLFNLGDGKYARKQNAYVFDFDPARTLSIYEQFANDLSSNTSHGGGFSDERKRNVRRLLNFFPVLGEDENGQMIELDAERVLSIPRRIHAHEVVRRGFMSDFLFQNIANIFHAPQEVRDIIESFQPTAKPDHDLGVTDDTANELSLNEDGDVELSDDMVIGQAADIFGDKIFDDMADDLESSVTDALQGQKPDADDAYVEELSKQFANHVTKPLMETAQKHYGNEIKPSQRAKIERKIKADVDIEINRRVGDFKIQCKQAEFERDKALETAQSETEVRTIEATHREKVAQAKQELTNNLLNESRETLAREVGQTIVREVETAAKEARKQTLEAGIRDHLRGFSRTIPSFLMAYGKEDTTLENFDSIIPADVFKEVTSITVEQFRFLRDGGDYTDDDGNPAHFNGHLFDSVVFDDSVKEFIGLRTRLANYFDENQKEDIFDYVPPQKTNQIFTPRKVVVRMIDLFEKENPDCFDDPDHTFADLYMKSGLFITEIVKRLYNSERMRQLYPEGDERLEHIFGHQVFGVAPSQIIFDIATHFILGYNGEVGDINKANFAMADTAELAKEGKLDEYVQETFGDRM